MDPNEIFEYVVESMKWLAIGGGSYMVALTGFTSTQGISKRIRSQEELEQIVSEEATKLGLDFTKIDTKYNGEVNGSKKNGERYDLHLEGNWLSTKATVRHELYHIAKGHCDDRLRIKNGFLNELDYWLRREPQASLYGSFGIKL